MPARVLALFLALAIGLATLSAPPPARAQDEAATLVINLTSDDLWTQQMALQFAANYMQLTGEDVVLFLNVRSVGIANRRVPQHTTALAGETPQQLLMGLMEDGARVFLCPGCTRQAGLSLDDRIEGVEPSGPAFHEILSAPGTRVMSY